MKVKHFSSQSDFRKWLERNHNKKTELYVGFHKVKTGKPSMNWSQSVDQALCFGWIDGIRKSIDTESYCIRFTPRKLSSNWSEINLKKVDELTKQGLMMESGLEIYRNRKEEKTKIYSFENRPKKFSEEIENKFKANKDAWDIFNKKPPSFRKMMTFWIMSAKQEKTRYARLEKLIKGNVQKIL